MMKVKEPVIYMLHILAQMYPRHYLFRGSYITLNVIHGSNQLVCKIEYDRDAKHIVLGVLHYNTTNIHTADTNETVCTLDMFFSVPSMLAEHAQSMFENGFLTYHQFKRVLMQMLPEDDDGKEFLQWVEACATS